MPRTTEELQECCRKIRVETLKMVYGAQSGHIGGSFSITETLASLYLGDILRHNPQDPKWTTRDRVIFSKGHASPALYATLALSGYFPVEDLAGFRDLGSRLQGHPVSQNGPDGLPGVEFCGGSLGQGLSFGIGQALLLKRTESPARVIAICSEGDYLEGEMQEALLAAPKNWSDTLGLEPHPESKNALYLDNLFVLLDVNGILNDTFTDRTVPLGDIFAQNTAKGWEVHEIVFGNDIKCVHAALNCLINKRKSNAKPVLIILYTQKGYGVSFMKMNSKFHGEAPSEEEFHRALYELAPKGLGIYPLNAVPNPQDMQTPKKPSKVRLFERAKKGARDAFGDAVIEIMEQDKNVWAAAADLAKSTRLDKVASCFPDRFVNVGPQEQNLMGIAAGLAAEGQVVFASTFAVFAELGFERVRQQIAIPNLNVKLLLSHAGFTVGKDGKSAQTFEHIGLWRLLPNMRVAVPADYTEAKALIHAAHETTGPFVILASRENFPEIYTRYELNGLKQMRCMTTIETNYGKDAAIIACGLMFYFACLAAKQLSMKSINVRVVNMPFIKPLDETTLLEAARDTRAVVVAEEHSRLGGLAGAVCELFSQRYPVPVEVVAINDTFGTSGPPDEVLEAYGLTPDAIVNAVMRVIRRK